MTTADRILQLLDQYPPGARARRDWELKRNGKKRPIAKPNRELSKWLQAMNTALNDYYRDWPDFMHGGIKRRSYVSYARPHVGKACVITVDIRDCFGSISTQQVATTLGKQLRLEPKPALALAQRLCFRGKIGQGFATSNFICNLYLLVPLQSLHASFTKQVYVFTNYVDDLALSGTITDRAGAINQIAVELSRSSLAISKDRDKICVMPASMQQVICGLLVNRRLTLTRDKKRELLSAIARGTMSSASVAGWIANLKTVDPAFRIKLHAYAIKKGLLTRPL